MTQGLKIVSQDRCQSIAIKELPLSDYYFIPYPENCTIKKNDILSEGQIIVKDLGDNILTHSPVTGLFKEIQTHYGDKYIVIETNKNISGKKYSLYNPEHYSREEFIEYLRQAGVINGMGIPLYQQIKQSQNMIHTICINGVENEPFITCHLRLLIEKTKELLLVARLIKKFIGAKIILAIPQNRALVSILEKFIKDDSIQIVQCSQKYPYGNEHLLIQDIFKKEYLLDEDLLTNGYLIIDITTLFASYEALYLQKPMINRIITVDGAFCSEYGNFLVKIGTPISAFMRPFSVETSYVMITGNPINGELLDQKKGISKTMKSILIFEGIPLIPEKECIFCSKCIQTCPIRLNPINLVDKINYMELEDAEKEGMMYCIDCNLCSYVCPSYIPLGEIIIKGKQMIKQRASRESV